MDTELFQRIIVDYQSKKLPSLTTRELKLDFIPNMALGIVGTRRGGKTFRTHQLVAEIAPNFKLENYGFNSHFT